MRTIVKAKNIDVPAADRRYAEQKMQRLERLLDERSDVVVELSMDNHGSPQSSHAVDVSLVIDGRPLRGVARASSHRAALDEVIDKLERRAVSHKQKPLIKRKLGAGGAPGGRGATERVSADRVDERSEVGRAVVKVKRFAIEPMFEEDAVARMEELGHSFFVFVNAENERVSVLYRRRDGDYGLIEPQIGGAYGPPRSANRS